MEQPTVSGVLYDKNQAKITVKGLPDHPGVAAKVFTPLSDADISVDMIIQNISDHGLTDISEIAVLKSLPHTPTASLHNVHDITSHPSSDYTIDHHSPFSTLILIFFVQ